MLFLLYFRKHLMSQWFSFCWYSSVHIRCRSALEYNFFRYDTFNEDSFGMILINNCLCNNLLGREFNFLSYDIHDPNLQLILSFSNFFQLSQMDHTFLFILWIIGISFEFAFKLKYAVFVFFIIRFPLELYSVHWLKYIIKIHWANKLKWTK